VPEDREIGTEHSAQITAAALLRVDHMRWMVSLGIKSGRKSQNFGRTELNAKTASLTALHFDNDVTFCHSHLDGVAG
jgi:hypothetical protein